MAKSRSGFEITVARTLNAEESTMFNKTTQLTAKLLKAQALADEIAVLAVKTFPQRTAAVNTALDAIKRQGLATAKALAKCIEAEAELKAAELERSASNTVDPAE